MNRIIIVVALVVMASTPGIGRADSELIFFCNYDVLLSIDDTVGQINSRARVRDGHTVPINFHDHKIEIAVADGGEGRVEFAITLFERSGEHWYQINPEPLTFGGMLGVPVQYQWSDAGIVLDVAISVSSSGHEARE